MIGATDARAGTFKVTCGVHCADKAIGRIHDVSVEVAWEIFSVGCIVAPACDLSIIFKGTGGIAKGCGARDCDEVRPRGRNELTVRVIAPAVDGSIIENSTGMPGADGDFTKGVAGRIVDPMGVVPNTCHGAVAANAADISPPTFNMNKALGGSGVVSASPASVGAFLMKPAHKVFTSGQGNKVRVGGCGREVGGAAVDIDAGHGAARAQTAVIRCAFCNGDEIVSGGDGGWQIVGVSPAFDAAVTDQPAREVAA